MGIGAQALLSAFARARNVPRKGWKVLTTKEYKGFYKGKGAMKAGRHTPFGNFRIDPAMLPRYVLPSPPSSSSSLLLRPYVANYPGQRGARSAEGLAALIAKTETGDSGSSSSNSSSSKAKT